MNELERLALAGDVERIEAEAWAQLNGLAPAQFRDDVGMEVHRARHIVSIVAAHSKYLTVNRVLAFGCPDPATEGQLDDLLGPFRAAGVAKVLFQLSPLARPRSLIGWIEARGGYRIAETVKIVRRVRADERIDTPCDLRIRTVQPHERQMFEEIVAPGLGVPRELTPGIWSTIDHPGWRYYFALDADEPVAAAAAFIDGTHVWFGLAATRESHRRRGAQTMLLAKRLEDAAREGCTWASADTSVPTEERPNQSLENMHRIGFTTLYNRLNYVVPLQS